LATLDRRENPITNPNPFGFKKQSFDSAYQLRTQVRGRSVGLHEKTMENMEKGIFGSPKFLSRCH
jgi:hypothetical protein